MNDDELTLAISKAVAGALVDAYETVTRLTRENEALHVENARLKRALLAGRFEPARAPIDTPTHTGVHPS